MVSTLLIMRPDPNPTFLIASGDIFKSGGTSCSCGNSGSLILFLGTEVAPLEFSTFVNYSKQNGRATKHAEDGPCENMAGEILGSIFRAEAEGSKFYGPCCMILSDLQKHSSRKKATHGQFLIDFFISFPLLVLLDHTNK
jgi:hypothetical protein